MVYMDNPNVWSDFLKLSKDLLAFMEKDVDLDQKLDAFDRYLEKRDDLIESIDGENVNDSVEAELKILDNRIKENLQFWMSDTQNSIDDIKNQREAVLKIKRSKGGYTKLTPSSEGYFFDKRK